MKPLNENRAGRLLHSLTEAVFRHPRWFWAAQLLLLVAAVGYAVARLQFTAKLADLLPAPASFHAQFLEMRRAFSLQDNLIVLVESANRDKNREFVERLGSRLRGDGKFTNVYYRSELKLLGSKALLFLPEADLAEFAQTLRSSQPVLQTFCQATNLDTLFASINQQFRMPHPRSSEAGREARLAGALQSLQWVLDRAADGIESREPLQAIRVTSLLSSRQHPVSDEFYFTLAQGQVYLLIAEAKDEAQAEAAVERLRHWVAQTQAEMPGLNVGITGPAVLRHDELQQARHDTALAALLALLLTALISMVSCHQPQRSLMACFCLLIGLGYTAGFAACTVGRVNLLSLALVPILIGLVIDYGVHLILRYEEELPPSQSPRLALGTAFRYAGLGVITNALVIAGAFYLLAATNFQGMWQWGWLGGSGLLLCLIPMLTLLPWLLVRGKPDLPEAADHPHKHWLRSRLMLSLPYPYREPRPRRGIQTWRARFEQLYLRRPWWVLLAAALFTVFAALGCWRLRFDYNLLNLQSRGLPAVQAQPPLFRVASQSLLYCAVVADSLPQAADWEQRINQLPSVARVLSLAKYLSEDQERKLALVHQVKQELATLPRPEPDPRPVDLDSLNQRLYSLSGYLELADSARQAQGSPPELAALLGGVRQSLNRLRHLTATPQPVTVARLTAFQQSLFGDLRETLALLQQQDDRQRLQPADVPSNLRNLFISPSGRFLLRVYPKANMWQRADQEQFIRELRTVDPQVTGSPVQFYEYTARLKANVQTAAAWLAGVIALLVLLHFRSVAALLLACLPAAFGCCWMVGLMGWLGIPFNPVSIVSLLLVMSLGVTNGVHLLNRFAEVPEPNLLARSTGKAVLVSALNSSAGFGSLLVAKLQGIASLGGVMALGTVTCVVASLAFLPAVLTLLSRRGWRLTQPAKPSA